METERDEMIFAITRPDPALLRYYLLGSLLWGPLCLIPIVVGVLRFRTLRYQFKADGITMSWGGLTRHEVSLAYSRIQDLHLRSNLLERWLGLARVEVQTAGGGGRPELTLEGLPAYEQVRAFLYERARREEGARPGAGRPGAPQGGPEAPPTELASALREVAAELRVVRQLLEEERAASTRARP